MLAQLIFLAYFALGGVLVLGSFLLGGYLSIALLVPADVRREILQRVPRRQKKGKVNIFNPTTKEAEEKRRIDDLDLPDGMMP